MVGKAKVSGLPSLLELGYTLLLRNVCSTLSGASAGVLPFSSILLLPILTHPLLWCRGIPQCLYKVQAVSLNASVSRMGICVEGLGLPDVPLYY